LRDITVAANPSELINAEGAIALNDRPHQLKLSASYMLPYDVYVAGNYRMQSGPEAHRTISAPLSFGGGSTTVNLEAPGTHRLDPLRTIDVRLAKTFPLADRELELNLDIFNLTNANTVWEVRNLTGRINVRQGGDPQGTLNNIQQFLSPTQILAPRIIRFGAALRF
jgi:hypothetical protein